MFRAMQLNALLLSIDAIVKEFLKYSGRKEKKCQ
jgi:hypothetical protein